LSYHPPPADTLSAPTERPPARWGMLPLPATFASLQHRNFRLLWIGSLISSSGDWMDQVAFNWLVYDLTGSAISLGLVNLCRMAPILVFTLFGGVVADRVERRRLLFVTQTVAMLLALALAVLVSTGWVQIWMVMLIAAGRGVAMSFNQPARQSLVSELVPQRNLMNAIALNSAAQNLTRVIGPAIGGLLIATTGVAGAFYFNAASFLAVLWGLTMMQIGQRPATSRRSIVADLVDGLRYLRGAPDLLTLVVLALIPMTFGMPYMSMLTVYAKDVLQVGGAGLGLLTACAGIGAVAGALTIASLPTNRRQVQIMLLGLVGFGISLLLFAVSSWLWLSVPMLLLVGVTRQTYMTSNNSLLQSRVSNQYRGRVLSILFLDRGLVPLGTILAGAGTEWLGPQVGLGGLAAVLLLLALGALRFAPATMERRDTETSTPAAAKAIG
jgi:MFS transporter, DHA1 family, staphyloferrin A biosynthesis exporter